MRHRIPNHHRIRRGTPGSPPRKYRRACAGAPTSYSTAIANETAARRRARLARYLFVSAYANLTGPVALLRSRKKPSPDRVQFRDHQPACRSQQLEEAGDSRLACPRRAFHPGPVRQYQRNAHRPGQARAIGMATNFVASSDFNRIKTVRLPFLWASLMALRTSAGVVTFFPPTSRMTSPVLKPCSEASPLGSTSVTTTPSEPLPATCPAGASIRPSFGTSVPVGPESGMVARASRSFGNSPSVSEMLFSSPLRQTVSFTLEPDAIAPICLARSRASLTALPLTAVITSPERTPAFAAGLPACGSVTSAPSVPFMPRLSAMSAVTG